MLFLLFLGISFLLPSISLARAPLLMVVGFEGSPVFFQELRLNQRDFLEGVTAQFTNRLAELDGVRVVERSRVLAVLQEQDLGQTGRVDTVAATVTGRILGAEYLVLGTIERLEVRSTTRVSFGPLSISGVEAHVGLSARIVSTDTAEILGVVSGEATVSETGVSIQDSQVSFGTQAFSQSTLGKTLQQAIQSLARDLSRTYEDLVRLPQNEVILGRIASLLRPTSFLVDLGQNHGIQVDDEGRILEYVVVPGALHPVPIPYGRVRVVRVDATTATVEILQADYAPDIGHVVEFLLPMKQW